MGAAWVQDQERFYETLVSTSSELICFTDPDGRVGFANGASVEILGYEPEELVGRHFTEFLDLAEAFEADGMHRRTVAGNRALRIEITARRKDGSRAHLRFNSTPCFDPDGGFEGAVSVVSDVSELIELRGELEQLAFTDDLTGLANRRAFDDRLADQLALCRRYGRRAAVVALDIDSLKRVNDTHGHPAGDALIIGIGRRLAARLRETDLLARLRGDEFAALLPEAEEAAALSVAQALVATISARPFWIGEPIRATASAGVAELRAEDDAAGVIKRADQALYAAKRAGGGRAEASAA